MQPDADSLDVQHAKHAAQAGHLCCCCQVPHLAAAEVGSKLAVNLPGSWQKAGAGC